MLVFLRYAGQLTERKARLFAAGCCRRVWALLTDERSRAAVEAVERYADGLATTAELSAALGLAWRAYHDVERDWIDAHHQGSLGQGDAEYQVRLWAAEAVGHVAQVGDPRIPERDDL